MNIIIAILLVGLSGIVAQIIVLRELLVSFQGNELTIGIILANWVLSEAVGVYVIGKIVDRIKSKTALFIFISFIFSLILPCAVYWARVFKPALGIPFGEGLSLGLIFGVSFCLILPLAFLHGGLFSCACKIYSSKTPLNSIGKIYTWETLGTIIGGVLLTYLVIPKLNSFQAVFIISFISVVASLILISGWKLKCVSLGAVLLCFILTFEGVPGRLQEQSIKKQWGNVQILDYRNSNYANIVVTKKLNEYTFFYNGVPVITTPYPDRQFIKDFGNLPMLFSLNPERILIAGAGAGGLIAEALQYPVERIDYAEVDPLIISLLKKYPTSLARREFSDEKLKINSLDPALFLKKCDTVYDVIIIGLSNQSDLSSNRYFTAEFFAQTKQKLSTRGLISLWMPGSLTYMSQELKDLNASVLNALKSVYKHVRVIPGDYNIFIASDLADVIEVGQKDLSERLTKSKIAEDTLMPGYLEYKLSNKRLEWFAQQMACATKEMNLNLRPIAVFLNLKILNLKFASKLGSIFEYLRYINIKIILILVLFVTFSLFLFSRSNRRIRIPVAYSIFTTGLFGMSMNLLLVFAYQVFYGYLYQKISLLTAVFMAGVAAGSILISLKLERIKNPVSTLTKLEAAIAVFSLFAGYLIANFPGFLKPQAFYLLLLIAGMFMGLEFPLAGKLYSGDGQKAGSVSGVLYACDLMGGWIAGILTGVVFLPLLGFFDTFLLVFFFKLSSLFVLGTK